MTAVTDESLIVDVILGGFTIRVDDNVVVKLTLLVSSLVSINPHRQAVVQPFVEPPFFVSESGVILVPVFFCRDSQVTCVRMRHVTSNKICDVGSLVRLGYV